MAYAELSEELNGIEKRIKRGETVDPKKVEELLKHYGPLRSVRTSGQESAIVQQPPFDNPGTAEVLNRAYNSTHEGTDHPNYIAYQLENIAALLRDEERSLSEGKYKNEFFDELRAIKKRIEEHGLYTKDRFGYKVPVDIEKGTRRVGGEDRTTGSVEQTVKER